MSQFTALGMFELPPGWIEPALRACRLFNTSLDMLFYDVPGLVHAINARGEPVTTDGPHAAARAGLDLSAATNPEGSLLVVDPQSPPYVTEWKDVAAFIEDQTSAARPVTVATITGVGSSALGSAALAWNVAAGLERPALAIVPGYGVADVVLQGLGGWFGFGVYDFLHTKSHVQDALAMVAPKTAALGRGLSSSAPGARRVNGAPAFRTGCGSSDVLHALVERLEAITCLVGHSKGALSIANALGSVGRSLAGVRVVTLGCPVAEDIPGVTYHQYLGWLDALGALNAWGNRPTRWTMTDHSTNARLPLSMLAEDLVRPIALQPATA
jgi:hypothetical protein